MRPRRVMVIGQTGQLSRSIVNAWYDMEPKPDFIVIPVSSRSFDITDEDRVNIGIEAIKPDVIINTAAAHDSERCDKNPEWAEHLNVMGPTYLARHAPDGCRIIHISTDYVFDGLHAPYTEDDDTCPINTYGLTKRRGELAVLERDDATVVRTASLWSENGSVGKGGRNFLTTMMQKADGHGAINVVEDVVMSPTSAYDLGMTLLSMIETHSRFPPILNMVNAGEPASWYEFSTEIFHGAGMPATADRVRPVRSRNNAISTALDDSLLQSVGYRLPDWRESIKRFFSTLGKHLATTYKGGTSL